MKVIDMRRYDIVDSGQTWPHAQKPCKKEMLPILEQNESIVTWITPKGCENIADQIPVIRINGQYYSISLRMMKAIWRHVRLARCLLSCFHVFHVFMCYFHVFMCYFHVFMLTGGVTETL